MKFSFLKLGGLLILLASCSEPNNPGDPPPTGDTCHYFADNYVMDITTQWVYPTYEFEAVSINPNNANEFAYVRKHVANNTFELRKHNTTTGTDVWLADFPLHLVLFHGASRDISITIRYTNFIV